MPRLIITHLAVADIERCRKFLVTKSPKASLRAVQAIKASLSALITTPEIGRPCVILPECRELIIDFGDSGYIARYVYNAHDDTVHVLALLHQKEAGH